MPKQKESAKKKVLKTTKTSIRFTEEEMRLIKLRASETNQTMAQVIREGVNKLIKPKRR